MWDGRSSLDKIPIEAIELERPPAKIFQPYEDLWGYPKNANHAMSATRYGLTMLAGAGTTYDPYQKERELVQVTVTRRRL